MLKKLLKPITYLEIEKISLDWCIVSDYNRRVKLMKSFFQKNIYSFSDLLGLKCNYTISTHDDVD